MPESNPISISDDPLSAHPSARWIPAGGKSGCENNKSEQKTDPVRSDFALEPVFTATILPHRSLSRQGFMLLMGFLVAAGLITSIPFYILGAWPVMWFMGLDIVLIYAAIRYNSVTARGYEELVLSRIELLLRSVSWRGSVRETRFNPRWMRIEREEHPEFGTERLAIVEGRRCVEIAASLGREERGKFADAFERALATAKR